MPPPDPLATYVPENTYAPEKPISWLVFCASPATFNETFRRLCLLLGLVLSLIYLLCYFPIAFYSTLIQQHELQMRQPPAATLRLDPPR